MVLEKKLLNYSPLMVINMNFLPTSLILLGFFILTITYTIRNRKLKIETHVFINELLIALLFLLVCVLFPFMYSFHYPSLNSITLNYLWLFTSIVFSIEMIIWCLMLSYNAILSKKNPDIMAEREYSKYCDEFNENWEDNLKSEFGRKFLHLIAPVIIFSFWILGFILSETGFLIQWGLDIYSFSYFLIITVGYGFVIMFQVGDLARLNKFYILPKWAKNWFKVMNQSELHTFVASTPLVLALTPFLFAPFPILASVALITAGADAAACLIGKKYGKHSLRKNSNKTIEGFIAGGLCTFIIVFFVSLLFHRWMPVSFTKIILMSVIATILFLLVDFYAKNITDNILNPILTGFGMWIVLLF